MYVVDGFVLLDAGVLVEAVGADDAGAEVDVDVDVDAGAASVARGKDTVYVLPVSNKY